MLRWRLLQSEGFLPWWWSVDRLVLFLWRKVFATRAIYWFFRTSTCFLLAFFISFVFYDPSKPLVFHNSFFNCLLVCLIKVLIFLVRILRICWTIILATLIIRGYVCCYFTLEWIWNGSLSLLQWIGIFSLPSWWEVFQKIARWLPIYSIPIQTSCVRLVHLFLCDQGWPDTESRILKATSYFCKSMSR